MNLPNMVSTPDVLTEEGAAEFEEELRNMSPSDLERNQKKVNRKRIHISVKRLSPSRQRKDPPVHEWEKKKQEDQVFYR